MGFTAVADAPLLVELIAGLPAIQIHVQEVAVTRALELVLQDAHLHVILITVQEDVAEDVKEAVENNALTAALLVKMNAQEPAE